MQTMWISWPSATALDLWSQTIGMARRGSGIRTVFITADGGGDAKRKSGGSLYLLMFLLLRVNPHFLLDLVPLLFSAKAS